MSEELIKQCAREAAAAKDDRAAELATRKDHREKHLKRAHLIRSGQVDWWREVSNAEDAIRRYIAAIKQEAK